MQFDMDFFRGHPIIETAGRKALVDTGCPGIIGQEASFVFLGRTYPMVSEYHGATVAQLTELVGTRIDVLLGGAALVDNEFRLDWNAGVSEFSSEPLIAGGTRVPVDLMANCPVIEVSVGGETVRAFLDTGATVSYLPDRLVRQYPAAGEFLDFFPGHGPFRTNLADAPVTIGGRTVTAR